ncbi:MAG: hybrid sensor histidine kinase/response regulator [Ferruginibacter sp.]|nr:hybrid sensor histidine kinase/response regulator [Ferruginibacter sp.]
MVKILLVDDSADNIMSMEAILEKDGYTFLTALSGKEALKILLKEDGLSLILLDVRMPIMDGYETAELIYQREKLRHIPIIFITGQDYEDESVFKGYKIGAVDYIRKPVNPLILRSKVAVFAELQRKNTQLQKQEEKLIKINEELLRSNINLEKRVLERTSELETLNTELKYLNLSKDKFLSVISHDLRNPLTALLISSETLSSSTEAPLYAPIWPLVTIIQRTSKRILQQLNELVDWAQEQRKKVTLKPEKLLLAKAVDESLELLKAIATQKNIILKNKVSFTIFVQADTLMLRSIFQNLVTNAIKYTPREGTIDITATSLHKLIAVSITDSGIGMDDAVQQKLFTGMADTSIPGTNDEKGSGLGLILVKDFVTQQGGSISVESEQGKGTCITFTIPQHIF